MPTVFSTLRRNEEEPTLRQLLAEIRNCNKVVKEGQESIVEMRADIDKLLSQQDRGVVDGSRVSVIVYEDNFVFETCRDLVPEKLIKVFEGDDKRLHGIYSKGQKTHLLFMKWCRDALRLLVYTANKEKFMTNEAKKAAILTVAKSMLRVMSPPSKS
jgi:hypothetical protein